MSDEQEKEPGTVESLFDLEYHQTGEVGGDWKVTRVPNGWIYQSTYNGFCCFVPEYIPLPPVQEDKEESNLLDAEICDFLNVIGPFLTEPKDEYTRNRLIRQIQKRNRKAE